MDQKIHLSRLEPELAAALLVGCERLDPSGMCEAKDLPAMTNAGLSFCATADEGQAVYVLRIKNGVAWVDACKGNGPLDWSSVLLQVIEQQAQGLESVAFQTRRRGLIKKAKQQGYTVAGVILRKSLQ